MRLGKKVGRCAFVVLAILSIVAGTCDVALATDVSGYQWGTWDLVGSPYVLVGDVTVPASEPLNDSNGNGVWDDAEPFQDYGIDGIPGTSDPGEGNGQYNLGEPFTDLDGDSTWDPAETFTDLDGDEHWTESMPPLQIYEGVTVESHTHVLTVEGMLTSDDAIFQLSGSSAALFLVLSDGTAHLTGGSISGPGSPRAMGGQLDLTNVDIVSCNLSYGEGSIGVLSGCELCCSVSFAGAGSITDCSIGGTLGIGTADVQVTGNSFTGLFPLYVTPETNTALISGNTFGAGARIRFPSTISGVSWSLGPIDGLVAYYLYGASLTIASDAVLSLQPGVRLVSDDRRWDVLVDGTLESAEAVIELNDTWDGNQSILYVGSGGSVSITGGAVSGVGAIDVYAGGELLCTGTDISIADLRLMTNSSSQLDSSTVGGTVWLSNNAQAAFTSNSFESSRPLHLYAGASVGDTAGNTFPENSRITVSGTVSDGSWTLSPIDGMTHYGIQDEMLNVAEGAQLVLAPSISLRSTRHDRSFYIAGQLTSQGASIELECGTSALYKRLIHVVSGGSIIISAGTLAGPGYIDVDAGEARFTNTTLSSRVYYTEQSLGSLAGCTIEEPVYLGGDSIVSINCCHVNSIQVAASAIIDIADTDFTEGMLVAGGSAESVIDAAGNYWGTADPEQIATKITDCNDNPALPCVEFEPFLLEPPVHCDVPCTGNSLIVDTPGYELWGEVGEYDCIKVINGGSIVVPPATWNGSGWDGGWLRLVTNTLYIGPGCSVSADGAGYPYDLVHGDDSPAPGGDSDSFNTQPGGGGYGGEGGRFNGAGTSGMAGGGTYGTCTQIDYGADYHVERGSRGGNYLCTVPVPSIPPWRDILCAGGRGGGAFEITAQDIHIDGTLSANGNPGVLAANLYSGWEDWLGYILQELGLDLTPEDQAAGYGSGGGSGGQIVLEANSILISATGRIEANGGNTSIAGAGGGGRILIAAVSDFVRSGVIVAEGGIASESNAHGVVGSVCTPEQFCVPGDPVSTPPSALNLLPDDDTGRSNADYLTTITTPRITGTAPEQSYIELYEGTTKIGSGLSNASGQVSAQVSTALSDGPHTITATARQYCHTDSPMSTATVEFTIDTQPPAIPSTPDLLPSSDTGSHDDDDITRDWGPYIEGTCEPDMDVTLYEGTTPLGTVYTADGNWQIMSSPLEEGTRLITATATDAAGNESAQSSALSILVDKTDPVISDMSVVPTDCQTIGQVFTLQATVTDALSGIPATNKPEATIRQDTLTIDHFDLQPVGGNVYRETWDSSGTLAGTYSVDFEARDLAGNLLLIEDADSICLEFAVGDMNCDGWLNEGDIPLFVEALLDPAGSDAAHPNCLSTRADVDNSGEPDGADILEFVMLLVQT